jgi:hypothetical protein
MSFLAFAAFFYRNHGFITTDLPEPDDLEMVMRCDLHFVGDDDDFGLLFHTVIPSTVEQWSSALDDSPTGIE